MSRDEARFDLAHQRKLARLQVQVSRQPSEPARRMSAFEALGAALRLNVAGDFPAAAHLCNQLTGIPGTFTESRVILLDIEIKLQRPLGMSRFVGEILAKPPKHVYGILVLCMALRGLGRQREAIGILDRAIRTYATNAALREQRAMMLSDIGERDLARKDARTAIGMDGADLSIYRVLSFVADLTDGEVATLEAAHPAEDQRADVFFALATAFRKRGDLEKEFHYLDLANAAVEHGPAWDEDEDNRLLASIREVFDAAFFTRGIRSATVSRRPIFVVSMPRSGSTLVEQILASHPGVDAIGETKTLHWVMSDLKRHRSGGRPFPEFCREIGARDIQDLGEKYDQAVRTAYTSSDVFVDKQPDHDSYLGLLALALPEARFVHVVRNPLDTCLSCYQQVFPEVRYSHRLDHLAAKYRNKMALMAHWKSLLPERIFTIAYEDLVTDPDRTTRRLLEFCGLDPDERVVEASRQDRAVRTASVQQVREGIYSSAVEKWRPYEKHLEPVRRVLGL